MPYQRHGGAHERACLVAIYNVACAEFVTLARKMGLDPQDVLNLFGNSPVIANMAGIAPKAKGKR